MENNDKIIVKLIVIGDSCVGKTSILNRYTKNNFDDKTINTIGVIVLSKEEVLNNTKYQVLIWDTAGQEKYRSISSNYYRNSSGILLVYSITDLNSFKNIEKWMKEIRNYTDYNTVIFLVGNKSDLAYERVVSYEDGYNLAKNYGLLFFETSAKKIVPDDKNIEVKEIFTKIITEIKKSIDKNPNNMTEREIDLNILPEEKKSCC